MPRTHQEAIVEMCNRVAWAYSDYLSSGSSADFLRRFRWRYRAFLRVLDWALRGR